MTRHFALASIVALLGPVFFACHVPISPSAALDPVPASAIDTTGLGFQVEYPALDMLGTVASPPDASAPHRYPTSGIPYFKLQLSTGINPRLSLQFGVDGSFALLPAPHGAWVGVRGLVSTTDTHDIGFAVRGGYAGFLAKYNEVPYDDSTVRVVHASVTGAVRFKTWDIMQPGVALTVQPVLAVPTLQGGEADTLYGASVATTLSGRTRYVTPFVTGGLLMSNNARGLGPFFSFGLAVGM